MQLSISLLAAAGNQNPKAFNFSALPFELQEKCIGHLKGKDLKQPAQASKLLHNLSRQAIETIKSWTFRFYHDYGSALPLVFYNGRPLGDSEREQRLFLSILKDTTNLKKLDLSGFKLSNDQIELLANHLQRLPQLEVLDLNNTHLTLEQLNTLAPNGRLHIICTTQLQ